MRGGRRFEQDTGQNDPYHGDRRRPHPSYLATDQPAQGRRWSICAPASYGDEETKTEMTSGDKQRSAYDVTK